MSETRSSATPWLLAAPGTILLLVLVVLPLLPTLVLSCQVYDEYMHELNWPMGAAIAVVVLVANLAIMLACHRAVELRARRTLG